MQTTAIKQEEHPLSASELMPLIQNLKHAEKLNLMVFLIEAIAQEDGVQLNANASSKLDSDAEPNPLAMALESDFIGCFEVEADLSKTIKRLLRRLWMINMVIADTDFFVALGNRRDDYHELSVQRLQELIAQHEQLITTCAVVTEASYLIFQRGGQKAQTAFMQRYENGMFEVFDIKLSHVSRIKQLMQKYADLPMDLADASLVVLAEHLGHGRVLSTDQRDFRTYRWKNHEPFENLLLHD